MELILIKMRQKNAILKLVHFYTIKTQYSMTFIKASRKK